MANTEPLLAGAEKADLEARRSREEERNEERKRKKSEERLGQRIEDDNALATLAGMMLATLDANDFGLVAFLPGFFETVRQLPVDRFGEANSCTALGILVVAPFVPTLMTCIGSPAKTCYCGLWIYVLSRVLFVPVTLFTIYHNDEYFKGMACVFTFTGFAYAFVEIGVAAWVLAASADKNRTNALSVMVKGRTVGSLLGPTVFGTAYGVSGRFLSENTCAVVPFIVGAFLVLGAIYLCQSRGFQVKFGRTRTAESLGFRTGFILTRPPALLAYLLQGLSLAQPRYIMSLVQPSLITNYGMSAAEVGFLITCCLVCLVIATHFTPRLESIFGPIGLLTIASFWCAFALLGVGPSPIAAAYLPEPSPSSAWLPVISMMVFVITVAPATVSLPSSVMRYAVSTGISENDAAAQVAMLNVLMGSSSTALGPLVAGVVAEKYGLPASLTFGCVGVLAIELSLLGAMKATVHRTSFC